MKIGTNSPIAKDMEIITGVQGFHSGGNREHNEQRDK